MSTAVSTVVHPWFRAHPVHHDNIVRHWERATGEEIRRGLRWYADAHHVAVAIAHGDTHLGAGMLAVYSPQQGWMANVLLAARVLHTGTGIGGTGSGAFATTTQKRAADRLLAGERYQNVLSGPKVRAFAHLIEHGDDNDPGEARGDRPARPVRRARHNVDHRAVQRRARAEHPAPGRHPYPPPLPPCGRPVSPDRRGDLLPRATNVWPRTRFRP
jgi:hypothetical protein